MPKRLIPLYAVYEKRSKWATLEGILTRWTLIAVCRHHSDALNLMHAAYPGKTLGELRKDIQCRTLYKWEVSEYAGRSARNGY